MTTRHLLLCLFLAACSDQERPSATASPSTQGGAGGAVAGVAAAGGGGGAGQAGAPSAAGGLDAAGNGAAGEAGNAGRAGNAGHAGSAGRAPFAACPPDLPGPVMVQVPVPGGQTDYCIDTTEVTQAQYAAFLAAKGDDVSGQRETCAWNKTYAPPKLEPGQEQNGECESPEAFDPEHRGNYPMACVDFCDAAAYCQWAGKRLCGKIGGGGVAEADAMSASKSQWYNACSMGGKHRLPYGDSVQVGKCNVKSEQTAEELGLELLWPTDGMSSCHGASPPLDQVRDMVGNLPEWEDCCYYIRDGNILNCTVRGAGAVSSGGKDRETCLEEGNTPIFQMNMIGFRCCLD